MLKKELEQEYEKSLQSSRILNSEKRDFLAKIRKLEENKVKIEGMNDKLLTDRSACCQVILDMEGEIRRNNGGIEYDNNGNVIEHEEKETDHKALLFKLLGFVKASTAPFQKESGSLGGISRGF